MAHQGKLFLCLASIALANELLDGSTSVCHPPLLQVPVRRFGGERHGNQEQAREYPLEGEGDLVRHGTRGCLEPLGYSGCDKLAQDPAEVVPGGEDGAKLHRCHLGGICRADDLEDAPGHAEEEKASHERGDILGEVGDEGEHDGANEHRQHGALIADPCRNRAGQEDTNKRTKLSDEGKHHSPQIGKLVKNCQQSTAHEL